MSSKYQVHLNQMGTKRGRWAVNNKHKTDINGKKEKNEEEDKGKIKKYL